MEISGIKIKTSKKKSGGSKKLGRNTKVCERYRAEGRREKNRARKLLKRIKREAKLQVLRDKRLKKTA